MSSVIKSYIFVTSLPPAIFFVNGDIYYPPTKVYIGAGTTTDNLTKLVTQLFIDDIMTKTEFDARVLADPNYPRIVHLRGFRILVILPTFQDGYNRHYADVVMFLHQGLVDIETNHFGPPVHEYDLDRINMYSLLHAAKSHDIIVPFEAFPRCNACKYPFFCDRCHTFSGINICKKCNCESFCGCGTYLLTDQGIRISPVYLPNCDNEVHNFNFINRK